MEKCRVLLLGRLQFERDNQVHTRFRTQKTASLLAYLALHPGPQPRELVSGIIWPDDAPEAGRHSLRMALSSLRRQLESSSASKDVGGELFESSRFAVGLKSGTFSTDVGDFDAAIREAHRALGNEARAPWYRQAVSLYQGPFLPGFYDEWCLTEATRLQGAFEDALTFLIGWHSARGETELARDYQRRLGTSPSGNTHFTKQPRIDLSLRAVEAEVSPSLPIETTRQTATNQSIPSLATLLAFDGVKLTSQLRESLLASGAQPLALGDSREAHLWVFSGATSALQGAAILREEAKNSLRLAICTGEMQPVGFQAPALEKRAGIQERVLAMLESAQVGQTLCCDTTMLLLRDHPEVQILDLGQFHLPGLLLGTPAERLFQLKWQGEPPQEFATLRATKARVPFVPRPLSRFFGREEELARLHELLSHERLVTISGSGGSGKTRLALQLAHSLEGATSKVIFWVPLADVSNARDITDGILSALSIEGLHSLSPFERIVHELNRDSSYSVVLLLDNFEHLVEEGAQIVENLLEKVPLLQCLTTSRRVLGVQGEVEMPLAPLDVPPNSSALETPESLEDQPSVRLFCDRARLVRPDFALTAHNAASVAELCRQLEGIPLALELAAARAGSLSPARILERLQVHQSADPERSSTFERFDFLQATSRTTPRRHRTLRAALDWSFEALDPKLQTFFSRLWVFRAGCSVEAAAEVGDNPDALDALEELRLCSLLFVRQNEEEPRFRMLDTVRQYALERASQRGEVEATRRHHAAYFLKWAETEAPHAIGADATARLQSWNRVRAEADNLRAALAWATEHEPEWALRLAMACHDFTGVHLSEREMNVERALYSVEQQSKEEQRMVSPFLMAGALGVAATHASSRGDVAKQTEFSGKRLALMHDASNPEDRAWALFDWGCARRNAGHFAESREALEQSQRIFEQVESPRCFQLLGWTLQELGLTAFSGGDLEVALRDFKECERAFTQSGDRDGQASGKSLQADILFHQGQLAGAQDLWREVQQIERELGDEREHAWRRHQEGKLAVALGDLERGHRLLCRALRVFWMEGHKAGAVRSLLALSSYWLACNKPEQALSLLRLENTARIQSGWPRHEGWEPLRQSLWEAACRATSTSLIEEDGFDDAPLNLATAVENELRGIE